MIYPRSKIICSALCLAALFLLPGIRPNCPLFEKSKANLVNNLRTDSLGKCFESYVKKAVFNGEEKECLRDTDAGSIWINTNDLLGEIV